MENFHWLNAVAGVSLAILGFFLKATYNRMIALETITNNGINQLNIQIAKLNENFKNLNSEIARYDKLEERTRLLEQRITALESHDS